MNASKPLRLKEIVTNLLVSDDLGNFNVPRYQLGKRWIAEYHKHFPISEPWEDHEDRNTLYAM